MTEERQPYESLAYAITVIVVNDYINACKCYYESRTMQRRAFYERKIVAIEHDFESNPIISYCFDRMTPLEFLHTIRYKISRGQKVYLLRTDYQRFVRKDSDYDYQGN